jgi:hypothetical protein
MSGYRLIWREDKSFYRDYEVDKSLSVDEITIDVFKNYLSMCREKNVQDEWLTNFKQNVLQESLS